MTTTASASNGAGRVPLPRPGVIVPLVTPLLPDRTVDGASLASLIEYVIDGGVDGVLVLGSAGECGALAGSERAVAIEAAVTAAAGRIHVMAGVASLGTSEAVEYAERFEALGADSLLVPAPYMFPPSDRELERHYRVVAQQVTLPVVAYEVPVRTQIQTSPTLLAELGEDGVLAGVKDSSDSVVTGPAIIHTTRSLPGFVRYTGCEQVIAGLMMLGYDGCVPGMANLLPERVVALTRHVASGEWEQAAALQRELVGLFDVYSPPLPGASGTPTFFAGAKEALRQLGVIEHSTVSEPFLQPDEAVAAHVRAWIEQVGALAR